MRAFYRRLIKFFYYGYHGSKCYDFDAGCIHTMIYAHMKRVNKFMHSDNTHLMWNSDPDTKGMKRLREFTALSKSMSENELHNYYFYGKFKEKYPSSDIFDMIGEERDTRKRRAMSLAFKKDRMVEAGKRERYWYMLGKYVEGFWD